MIFKLNIVLLLILPLSLIGQTITLTPIGTQDVSGIPITVEHYTAGGLSGTVQFQTAYIPANRGAGSTTVFSSANADEASVAITFPSGFTPTIGTTTYTQGHVNANSWFGFGTTSSSGYQGNATNPTSPTIHITSVDNGSSDNNMSKVSTEAYTDGTWGDVFRVRYEGNCQYNQSGVNVIWDLYFVKTQPTVFYVVMRTFTADGSNQEQMGISSGSAWLGVNYITTTSYAAGTAFRFTSSSNQGSWSTISTQNTNATGQVVVSNPTNKQYKVTINTSQKFHSITDFSLIYMMFMKGNLGPLQNWDFYTCDCNNSSTFDWDDINFCYTLLKTNALHNKYIFTQAEKTTIEANPNTNYYNTYSPTQVRAIENQNQFYIMGTGIHNATQLINSGKLQ
jgi:hypothetical protein